MPITAKVNREDLIKKILPLLNDTRFADIEDQYTTFIFNDVFIAGDTYRAVITKSPDGGYHQAEVYYRNEHIFSGSFLRDTCDDEVTATLEIVAGHMADEFLKISGCLHTFSTFMEASERRAA
jgi:hypothetical protein